MLIHRSYRFRIRPTIEQKERLIRWQDALRAIWNVAHEQRLNYSNRGARQPSAFDQMKQFTELRAAEPWLADVPRDVASHVLANLDMAWQRCFAKISKQPHWKKKGRDNLSLTETSQKAFRTTDTGVVFPKIGEIRAVFHRPLFGKLKRCTISRDVDQWFVSIECEQEVPDPPKKHEPIIGIDRGITNLVADSNGSIVPNPKHWEKMQKKLARVNRVLCRRRKGSNRRGKTKERFAKIHRKIRRQRAHILHQLSAWYAKMFGIVVVEDLNIAGMGRGKLARQIKGAGWGGLITSIRYKIEPTGGRVELVLAAYSSQTCAQCQNVDKASRKDERYNCVKCGNSAHADVNAAKVLVQRFYSRRIDGEAVRGGSGEVSPPKKRKLHTVKCGHRSPEVRCRDSGVIGLKKPGASV